jgi:hypothetical protein
LADIQIKFIFAEWAESLAGRGFRKSRVGKIWFLKNLDTKILRTCGLAGRFRAGRSVTASVIITELFCGGKVGCHMGVWKSAGVAVEGCIARVGLSFTASPLRASLVLIP